jgi:protein TonB
VNDRNMSQPLAGETWVGDDVVEAKPKSDGVLMWLGGAQIMMVVIGLFVVLAVIGGGYLLMHGKSSGVKRPPKISLIPSTPPNPPPPKEEKKPEPPKEQKEVKEVQQAPPKNAPPAPPSQTLKMDGPAGDAPSNFGGGKITSDDLSKVAQGDKDGGGAPEAPKGMFDPFENFGTLARGEFQRYLSKNKDIAQTRYKVRVAVWVAANGHIERTEILKGTGDAEADAAIQKALGSMGSLSDAPPKGMPMPIRLLLQVNNR